MGHLSMKLSVVLSAVFLIQTATAGSNLRWVSASNGDVPKYAVAGGEDLPGEVLYVARIKLRSGLTPGKMDVSSKIAHATWGGKEYFNGNYEILTNPGWKSLLEWRKSSRSNVPANAVIGGEDGSETLYVGRVLFFDGHMIPGKASYVRGLTFVGYGGNEYSDAEWWVLVEHTRSGGKRGFSSRFKFHDLPGVTPLNGAPVRD